MNKKWLLSVFLLMIFFNMSHSLAADKKDPMLFQYTIVGTTQTYVDLEAAPGEQATFSIELYNSGTTTKSNNLFISDGVTANNGGTMILTPKEAQRKQAGAWFNITEEKVTLEPGQRKTFDFIVDVPPDASPGTHVAVLYLRSDINPGVESEKTNNGASFVINEVYSLSSAVIIRTGGHINYDFTIQERMEKEWIKNQDLTLFFHILNSGNIYDYPKANIKIYNDKDQILYEAGKEMGVVYPKNECSIDFLIPQEFYLSDIYKVVLKLNYQKGLKSIDREFVFNVSPDEAAAVLNNKDNTTDESDLTRSENREKTESDSTVAYIMSLLPVAMILTLLIRFVFFRKKPIRKH